jgi:hypothetical protein
MNDWRRDSDMIFTQITSGDFPTLKMAEQAVCVIYVPDMTISRAGISHALSRLERHYAHPPAAPAEEPKP